MLRYFLLLLPFSLFAQQTQYVDFKSAKGDLKPDFAAHSISGMAQYEFDVLKNTDTISIDAQKMEFSNVMLNDKNVVFVNTGKQLKIVYPFKKKKGNKLSFQYKATPKQALYFTGDGDTRQIWTQGQGKYTSNWFPSFDDTNEKMVFSMQITEDSRFTVVSNGILESKSVSGNQTVWKYRMKNQMSSYLLMLADGLFEKELSLSASGIPLENYLEPQDKDKFGSTYKDATRIFNFLEKEIGVAYPWEIYRQLPVQDFLYGGMENTTSTLFARDYVVDQIGYNDRDYTNVDAHELAHQWFGDMITAKSDMHHWLQEGFATYYALLAEKEVFGEDYFYNKLFETAGQLQQAAQTDSIPILNPKASTLSFYQKGAWALHALREGIGADHFRNAVKKYLQKYKFKNVETDEFLAEIKKEVPGYDTVSFKKRWLESGKFPLQEALALLRKNAFMVKLLDISGLEELPLAEKKDRFAAILQSDDYYPVKEEVIFQLAKVPYEEKADLVALALAAGNINVRQAVARTVRKFPKEAYAQFAAMLDDRSYITQEIVLNTLSSQFPEKRKELLDKMKGVTGFSDKNIRILWLTLALTTKDYEPENKSKYYDELLAYTGPKYESNVRQNAITNMLYQDPNDKNALQALAYATVHPKWQFTKFARERLRVLLKKEKYKTYYTELLAQLPEREKQQLENLLKEQ